MYSTKQWHGSMFQSWLNYTENTDNAHTIIAGELKKAH